MSHALRTAFEVTIALLLLAMLIGPGVMGNDADLEADDWNEIYLP
jgi:hypothetical protein